MNIIRTGPHPASHPRADPLEKIAVSLHRGAKLGSRKADRRERGVEVFAELRVGQRLRQMALERAYRFTRPAQMSQP